MSVLRGDTSDGLPGVRGIGDKTAAQLIAAYGSLAGLRQAVHSGDPALKGARRANLEAASDYLDVAPTVVRVARDAPVDDVDPALPSQVADVRLLSELASTYGVTNPLNRVLSALALG
jgi:5'-3' exonuclease